VPAEFVVLTASTLKFAAAGVEDVIEIIALLEQVELHGETVAV
jgi:hypothetical protein